MMSTIRCLLAIACIAVLAGAAQAEILDQDQELGNGSTSVGEGMTYAQTFTAGISGPLGRIEICAPQVVPGLTDLPAGVFPAGNVGYPTAVSIVEAPGGIPADTPLATIAGHVFADGWGSVDFQGLGVSIEAGKQYAILLVNDDADYGADPTLLLLVQWEGDLYAGGDFMRKSTEGWRYFTYSGESGLPTGSDIRFRTYIVPEPSATLLLMLGLAWLRRRGHR